ncbi:hypothetical protein AQUCO_10300006v1 [Aquilegia coerulea]|uniref:Uncharacterized protein n=1 Tax=Aquilegia coerulea TaxID=218851 RepID=A0A2G5C3S9_AQUCA|nr:hypothetical protein AQUCO_10300006v1 [Aquilegia coerulea]
MTSFPILSNTSLFITLSKKPIICFLPPMAMAISSTYSSNSTTKITSFHGNQSKLRDFHCGLRVRKEKYGILIGEEERRNKKRVVVVRVNQFGFNGGGGSDNARILGNLALAIVLTYLTMTGQLGWLLDAIVSIWLLAVILPIAGLGAFLWWAGRNIVQDSVRLLFLVLLLQLG